MEMRHGAQCRLRVCCRCVAIEKSMFGQTFDTPDLAVIGLLIILEGVLSIDNALVLGLLAKRLVKHQQRKALTYGLVGAFAFRFLAIGTAAYLLQWRIVKLLGGGYLLWVAIKHFVVERREKAKEHLAVDADAQPKLIDRETGRELTPEEEEEQLRMRTSVPVSPPKHAGFWPTVAVIELTDIAFAIDSILAAIALVGAPPPGHVGTHPKLWVVIIGGLLGVILMRFAAVLFIRLLERFPRFEMSAYLLVAVIGLKLTADWAANTPEHPHRLDFHDPGGWAFWVFWLVMMGCFAFGFLPQKDKRTPHPAESLR
jgi:YkoY family integral membrane protein